MLLINVKIYVMKKKIVGGKKSTNQATAIVDPNTGKLIVTKNEIKNVTLKSVPRVTLKL